MRAYRDDRAAALSLAAALQRENDLLRAENEHLRELVDPCASRLLGAFAQVSSAVAVTLMLLGAMAGAGLIVQQTASAAEANVTRGPDLGARLAVVSPHVVAEAPVSAVAAARAPDEASPHDVVAPPAQRRHRHRDHLRRARHHHRHRHRHHRYDHR